MKPCVWLWICACAQMALVWSAHSGNAQSLAASIPRPSERQLHWQRKELIMFLHFGVNTYTGREWGLGNENPNIFQPVDLNTTQWVDAAKRAGFKEMILVVKHHDGFFLFPNPYTNHTVQYSSWRDYKGDVAADFVKSCHDLGMDPAFYLSPWDRNYYNMTWKPSYNAFYEKTEQWLVTHYGQFYELWWDGANAVANRSVLYEWDKWLDILRSSQPSAVGGGCGGTGGVFDCGPDTAWIGNEGGKAPETVWSWHTASIEFPTADKAPVYGPYFCDVSIRPGWFWHENQNNQLKTLSQLVDIYFQSVGHNCNLQLNVPPNKSGLLQDGDVARLLEFGEYISAMYETDFAAGGNATTSSAVAGHPGKAVVDPDVDTYWQTEAEDKDMTITLELTGQANGADNSAAAPTVFNVVMLQEYLPEGQRVAQHIVDISNDGKGWTTVGLGTTIGNKRLYRLNADTAVPKMLRLRVMATSGSVGSPAISRFGLFKAGPLTEE
eukprot:scpid57451/ scgid15761/ Alpha-L-fucosidase 1; Alpha-1,3/4-fucosidase; Alpha-L-fucoside fucohydrolase